MFFDKGGRLIATTHLAVGAAVGLWSGRFVGDLVSSELVVVQTVVQVGTAFLIGTVSHLALDAIPHNDVIYTSALGKWSVLAMELVVILNIVFWRCYTGNLNFLLIFFGMAGGAWPDCVSMARDLPAFNNSLTASIDKFHGYCHSAIQVEPIPSLPIQILIAIVFIILLF